jgi:lipopolysaccharide/colanic/teichoic acid biosynthesis glycosyltransferase/nucleoside-diphosphate-sugar epimerase
MPKRLYDVVFAAFGLLLLSPFLAVIAAAVKLSDRGPVFFRQRRVGLQGRPFIILKFRTMALDAERRGASITHNGDARVTRLGKFLRKSKLDELPQLWNVLAGEMSLVGPRPEVPCYVARYNSEQGQVLRLKPGITDLATMLYRNEEELLSGASDLERVYVEEIMPRKLDLSLAYARQASLWEDTKIILRSLIPGIPLRTRAEKIAVGKHQVSHLRTVQIEDLLGRPPISLHAEAIRTLLEGRRVMVTGAGGSFGCELSGQIATYGAAELLLVERSEVQLSATEQELIRRGHAKIIRPLVADIRDGERMRQIFSTYLPELIFHAASHEHVSMMEGQPKEAIENNVFGTALLSRLSQEFKVERFVLISTDKAINPTSVMGASKRLAEMVVQDLHARNHTETKFMAVRFGNVLGSSGSVVLLFKEQIAAGGPVRVSDPKMTRYFMTIPESVGLVLQSTVQGSGGEIFLLDMGPAVRIVDLAEQMIRLYGFEPGKDIRIEFTGIGPGEKLFEELSFSAEQLTRTAHPKIMRLRGAPPHSGSLEENLQRLEQAVHTGDASELKRLLKLAVPEYQQPEPYPASHRTPPDLKPAQSLPTPSSLPQPAR